MLRLTLIVWPSLKPRSSLGALLSASFPDESLSICKILRKKGQNQRYYLESHLLEVILKGDIQVEAVTSIDKANAHKGRPLRLFIN